MDQQFELFLEKMESWFCTLEIQVPQPIKMPLRDHFVFRYEDKTLEQALVQKLARVVTGLHSARILLNSGFLQEQIVIHRVLDELQEDISFLSLARLDGEITELHERYLVAFYEEEFDVREDPLASNQKRPSIPRQKIRAYLSRKQADIGIANPSRGAELMRTLAKAYSGFVHGASPQIMNLFGGVSPRFHISGMLGSPHVQEHRKDLWNYFYRGLLSFNEVALVFRDRMLVERVRDFLLEFETASGKHYTKRAQTET